MKLSELLFGKPPPPLRPLTFTDVSLASEKHLKWMLDGTNLTEGEKIVAVVLVKRINDDLWELTKERLGIAESTFTENTEEE